MFNLVKKIVAGPKRTLTFEGLELDLTYISDRIIAMAFPACSIIQKTYRNNINDVAQYLKSKHGDSYLIINVSNRLYDYEKFQNKVKDYEWNDHQAPPLTTLILIGYQIYYFLKSNPEGVVAIHCNHGKGRTGTTIIAYMLLVGYMKDVQSCLKLYNQKRFSDCGYGVDQPCQLRYLKFVSILKRKPKIEQKIPFFRLKMVSQQGLTQKYRIKVIRTRDQKVIMSDIPFDKELDLKDSSNLLFSDCLFEIYQQKFFKEKVKIARINYNLFFVDNSLELSFSSDSIKLQKGCKKVFTASFIFQFFCLCHLSTYQDTKCRCSTYRIAEEMFWNQMRNVLEECRNITQQEAKGLIDWQKDLQTNNLHQQKAIKESSNSFLKVDQAKRRKKSANSQIRIYRQQKIYAKMLNFRKILASTLEVQTQHTQDQFKRHFSQNYGNLQKYQLDQIIVQNDDLKQTTQKDDIKIGYP